ncbi:Uncharacterized protein dnm_016130 [Desulfonema magnum]|uniref:Uncharacterized protein n=1 Tax=Desulfonema magnum TaxID=45655 RepID=A0A975GLC0_9BACT|nr:Uncharacterized protein dnm_016130 [Desulfonema magnum]
MIGYENFFMAVYNFLLLVKKDDKIFLNYGIRKNMTEYSGPVPAANPGNYSIEAPGSWLLCAYENAASLLPAQILRISSPNLTLSFLRENACFPIRFKSKEGKS